MKSDTKVHFKKENKFLKTIIFFDMYVNTSQISANTFTKYPLNCALSLGKTSPHIKYSQGIISRGTCVHLFLINDVNFDHYMKVYFLH